MARKSFGPYGKVTPRRVYDLVITGMECGSYSSFELISGSWEKGWRNADKGIGDSFAHVTIGDRYARAENEEGGATDEVKRAALTDAALERGLEVLAKKAPHLLGDFLADNEDAITGDAFLQCVVLGDVIYG